MVSPGPIFPPKFRLHFQAATGHSLYVPPPLHIQCHLSHHLFVAVSSSQQFRYGHCWEQVTTPVCRRDILEHQYFYVGKNQIKMSMEDTLRGRLGCQGAGTGLHSLRICPQKFIVLISASPQFLAGYIPVSVIEGPSLLFMVIKLYV